jgi:hypothetical protein
VRAPRGSVSPNSTNPTAISERLAVLPIIAGLTIFAEPMPSGIAGVSRTLGFAGAALGAALLAGEPAA